jgi:uncharacterized protein (DUF2249 family)
MTLSAKPYPQRITSHARAHGEAFMAALSAIHQLVGRQSQFIIATHSPRRLRQLLEPD